MQHIRVFVSLALVAFLLACSSKTNDATAKAPQPEWETGFTFQGKPIHPVLLKKFTCWLSDLQPHVFAVDLTNAAKARNEIDTDNVKKTSMGFFSSDTGEGSSFGYQWLGRLENGTHVVRTYDSGGGTGVFEDVLFLRFSWENGNMAEPDSPKRLILRQIGWYGLGDRDNCSIELKGNSVVIGASEYREKPVTVAINQ